MQELTRVPVETWHPKKTIECGQIFHWYREAQGYVLVRGEEWMQAVQEGEETVFTGDTHDPKGWLKFLGLDAPQDLSAYEDDPVLRRILHFSRGLRLLQQDPYVTILSFILSANNHFSRIRLAATRMAELWGRELAPGIHAFPAPQDLAAVAPETLRTLCNTGYRDRYIHETSRRIAEGDWDLAAPFAMDTEQARRYLIALPGIGPKVCDCILLFAYGKGDTFPVDVWMHRIMRALYPEGPEQRARIFEEAIARYGADAGLIQQMLFYYAKEHRLGTGKSR